MTRLTPAMRAVVRAPRGRCHDNGNGWPLAGRYMLHANTRTLRALVALGLAERVYTGPRPEFDAYALTPSGEELRKQLREEIAA